MSTCYSLPAFPQTAGSALITDGILLDTCTIKVLYSYKKHTKNRIRSYHALTTWYNYQKHETLFMIEYAHYSRHPYVHCSQRKLEVNPYPCGVLIHCLTIIWDTKFSHPSLRTADILPLGTGLILRQNLFNYYPNVYWASLVNYPNLKSGMLWILWYCKFQTLLQCKTVWKWEEPY